MRGKRGIQQIIIALFVIIALGSVLILGASNEKIITKIGHKQTNVLGAYHDAEKAREYFSQIARTSVYDAAADFDMSADDCFITNGFYNRWKETVAGYPVQVDLSLSPERAVILPDIKWELAIESGKALVTGKADDNVIVNGEDFEYSAGLFVNQTVTCDDIRQFYLMIYRGNCYRLAQRPRYCEDDAAVWGPGTGGPAGPGGLVEG